MFVFFTWILYPVPRAHFLKPERANSMQCSLVTAFSPASLFLKRFWNECRISFWFHKAVSKTRRPEKCQKWYFKWLLIFLCRILYFILMGSFRSEASISVWKSALKFNLPKHKPVRVVKTPWHIGARSMSVCFICSDFLRKTETQVKKICREGWPENSFCHMKGSGS